MGMTVQLVSVTALVVSCVAFLFVCPEHGVQSIVDPFEGLR